MAELDSSSPSLGLTSGGLNRDTSFSQLFDLITPYRTEKGVRTCNRDPMSPIVGIKRNEEYLSDSSDSDVTQIKKPKVLRKEKTGVSVKGSKSRRRSTTNLAQNISEQNIDTPSMNMIISDKTSSSESTSVSKELVALRCHYNIWINSDKRMTRSQLFKESNGTYNDHGTPTTSRSNSLGGVRKNRIDVLSKNKAEAVNTSRHTSIDKDVSPSISGKSETPNNKKTRRSYKNNKNNGSVEIVKIDYASDDEQPLTNISVGSISPHKNVIADINPPLENYISIYKNGSENNTVSESLNDFTTCKSRGKRLATCRRSKRITNKSNNIKMKASEPDHSRVCLDDGIFSTSSQNKCQFPPADHSNRDIEKLQLEHNNVLCSNDKRKIEPLPTDGCNSNIEVSQPINDDVSSIPDISINKSLPIVDYCVKNITSDLKNNDVDKIKSELKLFGDFKQEIKTSLPDDGKVLCTTDKSIVETALTDDGCGNDMSLPGHEGLLTSDDNIVEIESSQSGHDISTCKNKIEILQTNSGEMEYKPCSPVMLQSEISENITSYDPLRYDELSNSRSDAISNVHPDDSPEEAMIVDNELDTTSSSAMIFDQNESACDLPTTTDVCHTDSFPQKSSCNSHFTLKTKDLQEDSSTSQADTMSPQFKGFDDSHFYASIIYNLMHHICLSSDEEGVPHFQSINFRGKTFLLEISAKEIRGGDENVEYCPNRNKEDTSLSSSIRSPDDCGETDMFIDLCTWPCSTTFENEADLMKNDAHSSGEVNSLVNDCQTITDDSSSLPETTHEVVDCRNSGRSVFTTTYDEDQCNHENDNSSDDSSSSNNCPKQDISMLNFSLRRFGLEKLLKNYRGPKLEEVKTNKNYCSVPAFDGFVMMPKVASSWRISSSGWKKSIRRIVKEFCDIIGAKYTEDATDTYNVLVVPANYKDRRTFKLMLSIASRAFIVSLDWVVHSLHKRIVPYPEIYLLYKKGGPSRCLKPDIPPPLIGTTLCTEVLKEIVDKSDFSPKMEDLYRLCHLVGAVVVKSIDDFMFIQNEKDAPYPRFLLFKKEYQLTSQILSMCSRHSTVALNYKWLYDSITSYRRLPIKQYVCTTFFFTPDLFEKEYKIPKDLLVEDPAEDDESEDNSNHRIDNESL